MSSLYEIRPQLEKLLRQNDIKKYAFTLSETELEEFNVDNDRFSLYRTLFENAVHLTVFIEGRMGVCAGTDLSQQGLSALVESAVASARAGESDPAYDIAPLQPETVFETGCYEPDRERFFARCSELLDGIRDEYPLIRLLTTVFSHAKAHTLYRNSNGTAFEKFGGCYSAVVEFSANDGEKTTNLDYLGLDFTDLDRPILEMGGLRRHLESSVAQLQLCPAPGKFTGTVILTPDCLQELLWSLLHNTVGDTVILNGSSPWLDSVGKSVVDARITLDYLANHPDCCEPECFTDDGFLSEDLRLIDQGVLQGHLLSLYVANKTGRPVAKNTGGFFVMEHGEDSLETIISGVQRGLVVGGFSGGEPEVNGEFSGVAKNSFYVENGRIVGAVTETMISGNLLDMLRRVVAVSAERERLSSGLFPWLAVDNIVISGK